MAWSQSMAGGSRRRRRWFDSTLLAIALARSAAALQSTHVAQSGKRRYVTSKQFGGRWAVGLSDGDALFSARDRIASDTHVCTCMTPN